MDLGYLAPQVGLNFVALLEVYSGAEIVHRGFSLSQHAERGADRRQDFSAAYAVETRVAKPTQCVS